MKTEIQQGCQRVSPSFITLADMGQINSRITYLKKMESELINLELELKFPTKI